MLTLHALTDTLDSVGHCQPFLRGCDFLEPPQNRRRVFAQDLTVRAPVIGTRFRF